MHARKLTKQANQMLKGRGKTFPVLELRTYLYYEFEYDYRDMKKICMYEYM